MAWKRDGSYDVGQCVADLERSPARKELFGWAELKSETCDVRSYSAL